MATMDDLKQVMESVELAIVTQTSSIMELVDIQERALEAQRRSQQLGRVSRSSAGPGALGGLNSSLGSILGAPGQVIGGAANAIGGVLTGIGGAAGGAGLGILGTGLGALSVGLASFANPATLIGGTAVVAFFGGLAGVTWLFGKGVEQVGKGFETVASGMTKLDEAGKTVNTDNMIKVGEDLAAFLNSIGETTSPSGLYGAAITFLTGDLDKIASGLNNLSNITVDEAKLEAAGQGLNVFLKGLGEGSFWDKFKGVITSTFVPDMQGIVDGVNSLSGITTDFTVDNMKPIAEGMELIYGPLSKFSVSGFFANFVGANALTDLVVGINSLNGAQVDNLASVSQGILSVDNSVWEFVKTGLVANFVGKNAILDLVASMDALNKLDLSNAQTVSDNISILDANVFELVKTGLVANFVGKNAIIDLADGAKYMVETMGSDEKYAQSVKASEALYAISKGLLAFTATDLVSSLASVGTAIADFFVDSPFEKIIELADNADALEKSGNAIQKVADALVTFGNVQSNISDVDFEKMAKNLAKSIPLFEGLANGGKIGSGLFDGPEIDFGNGLLDPNLRLDEIAAKMLMVRQALTGNLEMSANEANNVNSVNDAGASGIGGSQTAVINNFDNRVTNIYNTGGDTLTQTSINASSPELGYTSHSGAR